MDYGKLVNGVLELAPENIVKEDITIFNYNLDADMMAADGYKPVIYGEKIDQPYNIVYTENQDNIEVNYSPKPTTEAEDKELDENTFNQLIKDIQDLANLNAIDDSNFTQTAKNKLNEMKTKLQIEIEQLEALHTVEEEKSWWSNFWSKIRGN
jgi:hypothetical protein